MYVCMCVLACFRRFTGEFSRVKITAGMDTVAGGGQ